MKKNLTISLLLGITLSAIALYFAFRNVPLAELFSYLISINYIWMIPAVLVGMFTFVLRALRWQVMLAAAQKLNFWQVFHPMMTGFMLNCTFPWRIGELARPIILKKKEKIPFSTALATVAAERVFDVSLLIVFFAIAVANLQIDPHLNLTFGSHVLSSETLIMISNSMLVLCLLLIAGIVMVSIERSRKLINRFILKIPSLFIWKSNLFKEKIQERFCSPLVGIVENFATGFSLVKEPKKVLACLVLSILVWFLSAFSFYIMSLGCPGIDLSFLELSTVMIIICFFIALPSVPGFWGLWEAGGVFALSIFGVSAKKAAGFTLANHAAQMFPVIIVGLVSAILTGVNIWRISQEIKESEWQ